MKSYGNILKHFTIISLAFLTSGERTSGQDIANLNSQNKSISYDQAIKFYNELDEQYEHAKLFTEGLTDIGRPLHLFVISADNIFDPGEARKKGKTTAIVGTSGSGKALTVG